MTPLRHAGSAQEKGPAKDLHELHRSLPSYPGFDAAITTLKSGRQAVFEGVWGSSCALLAAAIAAQGPRPLVVVTPQLNEIDEFSQDFELFSTLTPERFPAWENAPGGESVVDEIQGDRLRLLKSLLDRGRRPSAAPLVIVTSIESLLQPVPSRELLEHSARRIRVGDRVDIDELRSWLVEHSFHATGAVQLPGEFATRGGILDIFSPEWYQPSRIELFDDEVTSIRSFDVASQRSLEALTEVEVTVLESAQRDESCLTEYLPAGSWFLLLEPEQIAEHGRHYLQRSAPLESPHLHPIETVFRQIATFPVASAATLAASTADATCSLRMESVERFSGEIGRVREEFDHVAADQQIYLLGQTDAEVERLKEILAATAPVADGRVEFRVGTLRTGFRMSRDRVLVITAHELFHRGEVRRLPRRRLGKAIDSFLDLREGDLVVHLAHGIGRYRGLDRIDKDGHVEEHLQLEFHGGTKIYVPATKIDLVQKYVGGSKSRPSLAKIGGKLWTRQKKAAEAAVLDLASDMLDLQAMRQTRPGISFVTDSEWQREFDASFPYEETPDQLHAMDAIKTDMRAARPMDRLLCGDVGYGKTEVAMRAAFKAVDNGHQVAVLVPTTILAEQHYHTFRDRMAEFPFDIARLSRFCTSHDERDIIQGLATGRVDIVIGTHRIASQDIQFHNLGLVVIDEEQRFGVEVKERLKTLRATVDVLTLSATPIPRTLHMSLVGVRDISNLETAPLERMAVETRVARWDDHLIREAVLRELNRGGQIYFVHNRVQDIELVKKRLEQIVPEASMRVGHGQMAEDELERVMVDFVAGRFDMLVATTIVESGLDIPNANTIFIDEGERYGLADLHQLRGRVGRYKHRAYCYLLVDSRKHLTPNAARRLRAIEEFSEMGAGFAIAMRDLEIRGAGNLLGTQQSGHIAAVGYELYCQLLENAVRRLKQLPPQKGLDTDVDLPGQAWIPDDYVPDIRLKIDLYRRLSRVTTDGELEGVRAEIQDRFGPPPPAVCQLLARLQLKIDAAAWMITSIHVEDKYLVFRYANRPRIELLARKTRRLRIVDDASAYWPLGSVARSADGILNLTQSILRPD